MNLMTEVGQLIDRLEFENAEEALRISEARLAAGADLAGLGFYVVDLAAGSAWTDERFNALCGVPPECEHGLEVLEFWIEHLHPEDRGRILEQRRQLHAGRFKTLASEYRFLHPTAGERWIHHLARVSRRDADGAALTTYGALRDITESKKIEEALHDLSERLIQVHEQERALLARELHDDVTRRLALLAAEAGRAELAAGDGPQAESIRAVRDGLARLSEDIHTLAYQLHPSALEELGLDEALRAECERVRRASGIDLLVDLDGVSGDMVSRDGALCPFRIAQESLSNVIRHACAHAAAVALRRIDGGLLLSVRDDGSGFDPQIPRKARSVGLANMRERVRLVHGTLEIDSEPGRGTAIFAWVPGRRTGSWVPRAAVLTGR